MPADPTQLSDLADVPAGGEMPTIDPEASAALDELLAETTAEEATTVEVDKIVPIPPPIKPPDPAEPPAKKFVDDPIPAAPPPVVVPAPAPVKDDLDSVALPPYSKPKTGEAFAEVKRLARSRVALLEKERDELRAKTEELTAKVSAGLPREVEEELASLRKFRNEIDVKSDPEFAKFDSAVADNDDAVYTRLKTAGFTEDTLQKIKSLGGPAGVDWEALSDKISPGLKRFIDSKIVENETLVDKKSRAIKTAQEHAEEYVKSKATQETNKVKERLEQSRGHLQEFLPKVPWLAELKPKADATAEEKADVERHNKLVGEVNGGIQMILEDETPAMRAIMAVNYAQHLKLKTDHKILQTKTQAEITDLTAKLAEANDLLARVKNSSTNRLRNTPASDAATNGSVDKFDENPGSALDAIAKEVFAR